MTGAQGVFPSASFDIPWEYSAKRSHETLSEAALSSTGQLGEVPLLLSAEVYIRKVRGGAMRGR